MAVQEHLGGNTSDKFQLKNGDYEFAPKVRKPYTITKQRERWTDEEHNKFLEALKLYGRAWRKIEEYVGSKNAVQIRSHAQKFFSKVSRGSDNCNVSVTESIEIPPPRPKRKPMHPYPRKLISPIRTGISSISASGNLSTWEHENQSPLSVLSAVASESSGGASSRAPHEDENSSQEEQVHKKLELSSRFIEEDSNESASPILKLFGKTLLVSDPHGSSYSTIENYEPKPFSWNFVPQNFPHSNPMDGCFSVPLPWLTLCSGASFSPPEVHNPTPIKARLNKYEQKEEGSSTDSSTNIVGASGEEEIWDVKKKESHYSYKLNKRNSGNSVNCRKGFVPYKRCLTENSNISSTETAS